VPPNRHVAPSSSNAPCRTVTKELGRRPDGSAALVTLVVAASADGTEVTAAVAVSAAAPVSVSRERRLVPDPVASGTSGVSEP